ncbi:c-Myc-binding protein homolog [Drosophila hydei]|uniref:c-Myc-binding protein homolog n=1 Tax=Drosophila hydei TaxID=7224 RepID=A0A6J1LZR1_DROHY|nr:c-Myc-binding protein homolog [Drosophila hydei]
MSFKPIDPKRDEIRRYLERGSVLDSLTKIFIRVIKERPENPMEYIRNNIGVVRHQHDKYERLSQDLQEANEEIQRLRAIINSINPDVLRGHAAQIAGESDSEPVTATEQVENPLKSENNQDVHENVPEANGLDNTAVAKTDEAELSSTLDNCHIEEKNMAATDTTSDNITQTTSVQAELSRTDNAE